MALKVDHITLHVSSLDTSMPYYDKLLNLLGFMKELNHIWTDGNGFFLQFREAAPDTRPYERFGTGMNHLGFSAPSASFVVDLRDSMASAGFDVPAIQDFDGSKALFMKDPDGIRFEVTWYHPGAKVVE